MTTTGAVVRIEIPPVNAGLLRPVLENAEGAYLHMATMRHATEAERTLCVLQAGAIRDVLDQLPIAEEVTR